MKLQKIDHLVLLVKDLERTEKFYSYFLGEPIDKNDFQVAYKIGDTKIFFANPGNQNSPVFDKENLGLNHLAFHVASLEELKAWGEILNKSAIKNSGIQIDKYGDREFIWFDDPDGIRLEFYLR